MYLLCRIILLGISLIVSVALTGQENRTHFEYLGTQDGLPQDHVFHVTKDADGFMWFSTMEGLAKYDGFLFTNYFHDENDSTTLSSSYVNFFLQDKKGQCYIATNSGFNLWDRKKGKAKRFYHHAQDENSLGHNQARALLEDENGHIWIAHQRGLDKFDPQTHSFKHYYNKLFSVSRHSGSLAMDSTGKIWALGTDGLFYIDAKKDSLNFIKPLPPGLPYPPNEGRDLLIDSKGVLWVGYRQGLARYVQASNDYEVFDQEPFSLGVMKILEYKPGILAIATGRGGLILWDVNTKKILQHFKHSPFDEYSIRALSIYTMYIDEVKNIWLGLFHGISMTNLETERFRFIRYGLGFGNFANYILRSYKDPMGGIWSNTMAGLYFQPHEDSSGMDFNQPPLFTPGYKGLLGITGDEQGRVFFGFKDVGIYQYNYADKKLIQLDNGTKVDVINLHSFSNDDHDQRYFWICTSSGLYRWDKENGETTLIQPKVLNTSLSTNVVTRLAQNSDGTLYFINSKKICRLDPSKFVIDILPCSFPIEGGIQGIDVGKDILWIGTRQGIYRYDLQTKTGKEILDENQSMLSVGLVADSSGDAWSIRGQQISHITLDTIWQYNSPTGFTMGIGSRSADGRIAFGGENGLVLINPAHIYRDTISPRVVFRGIEVANKKVKLDGEDEYVQQIDLEHTDLVFTLHYAALHFNHRKGIRYKYQLTGFDKEWVDAGTSRSVTYTNLSHGKYLFKVIAITEDLKESRQPLEVLINIRPAFHQTAFFHALIALIGIGLLVGIYFIRRKASSLRKEKQMAEQQAAYKSMFLANMSHEIRTPLNAIIGLNNLLIGTSLNDKQAEYAKAINASCDNLLWIVNDILDQSKIESGSYSIENKPFDLKAILHQLEMLYKHVAAEKNIRLIFNTENQIPDRLIGDPVRLTQILSNLMNNALKFTDEGSVTLETSFHKISDHQVTCEFNISDTGIGIPEDQKSAIFESFRQVNEKVMAGNQGTGLGLSIVKHLVDKMKGDIQLDSIHGQGSTFKITLPFSVDENAPVRSSVNGSAIALRPGLRILLVEDAPLNQLVATELIKNWVQDPEITIAENGEIALEKIQQSVYDVVLMDVRMPVMDGLEATRRIRRMQDPYFKTVPIAGLTANVIPQQIEECLEAGMNAFISKPIRQDEFLQKLSGLLT